MKNEAEVTAYIAQTFPGVAVISAPGGSFYFYDPEDNTRKTGANRVYDFSRLPASND
jgi:hypothetical protein